MGAVLGVLAALPAEARCLAGTSFAPGALRRCGETLIHCTGPGEVRARRGAERLISEGAEALVSWGTAGALAPTLQPGDLVIADAVLECGRHYRVDPLWHKRLIDRLEGAVPIRNGMLLQSEAPVARAEDKKTLFGSDGALAVDMESAGIGAVACEHRTPFVILRAIVDTRAQSLPHAALAALDGAGGTRLGPMIWTLLRDPREIGGLARLALDFRAALRTLRKVGRLLGPRLGFD